MDAPSNVLDGRNVLFGPLSEFNLPDLRNTFQTGKFRDNYCWLVDSGATKANDLDGYVRGPPCKSK